MDIQKISTRILYVLFAISALVVILFYAVDFGRAWEENPTLNDPVLTDVLLWWNIILCVACFGTMIWSFIKYVKEYGFNKSYLYTWGLPVASVIIGLVVGLCNQGEILFKNKTERATPSEIILSDTSMIAIAILLVLAFVALIYSLLKSSKK